MVSGKVETIELPYVPTPRQSIAHTAVETNVLYGGAVGGGKSAWLVNEAINLCLDYKGNVGYLARHELESFKKTTLMSLEEFLPSKVVQRHNRADHEIELSGGSKILYGGLGDDQKAIERLKSMNLGFFGIDQAEETTETHFFMLSSRLRLAIPGIRYKALLTANPEPGWVRDRFISSRYADHVFIPALPKDNPHLPKDYEEKLRALYGNRPDLIKAWLEGDWDVTTAGDYLIQYSLIRAAVNRDLPAVGNCVVGVDVARFGDDSSVVTVRHGMKVTRIESWAKQDTVWTAGKCAEIIREENPTAVYVDEIGIGSGVVDTLRANLGRSYNIIGIISSEQSRKKDIYANRRAELYFNLSEHFLDGSISIPDRPELSSQLSGLKYKFDTHHRRIIESKDDMRRRSLHSPDFADSLMLCFATLIPESARQSEGTQAILGGVVSGRQAILGGKLEDEFAWMR